MRDNKILLVTGASSDMGTELIRRVYGSYSTVIAHYGKNDEALRLLQNEAGKERIKLIRADFENDREVDTMIRKIQENNLIPDHIVHFPAPKAFNKKFHKCSWEDYERGFKVSFKSIVRILTAFIPHMSKNRYGKIILMLTSYCINMPPKYQAPYVSLKYALLGLMKSLSAEYADKGIMVNGISPDMTETKFLSEIPELIVQKNAASSPSGRNLNVGDVVPAFQFLLSDAADMITGENLAITGGRF